MPHDVFISYASADAHVAEAVCAALEEGGYPCWMAPRDVPPGGRWAGAISRAVEQSGRGLVLVLSQHASGSRHVAREVTLADESRVPVVPYRIDQEPIGDDLRYYVATLHHILAPEPVAAPALAALCEKVGAKARRRVEAEETTRDAPSVPVLCLKVENMTQLQCERSDTELWNAIKAFGRLTEDEIRANGGRLESLESEGDRLATFETLEGAWSAASRIMEAFAASSAEGPAEEVLRVSIGLDCGPVERQATGISGPGVLVAGRLAGKAIGQTVLASEDFVMRLPASYRSCAHFVDEIHVAGLAHRIDTFRLAWRPDSAPAQPIDALVLEHGAASVVVDATRREVRIGRGAGCDLQVPVPSVSRRHAAVRWTPAGIYLRDLESTYGTWVRMRDGPEAKVHDDSTALGREGSIRLGIGSAKHAPAIVRFRAPGGSASSGRSG